jgi:segregation and condensation protein B
MQNGSWLISDGQSEAGLAGPAEQGQPGPAAGRLLEPEVQLPGTPDLGLRANLEAILLVADEPVPAELLAAALDCGAEEVSAALSELADGYTEQRRGFDLREVAGGWRYYTRAECAAAVERFVTDGQEVRLTQAALETLAVVAYR